MAFMDLSVQGKPSPRHHRPSSGKRSGYTTQNVNTKANIFGVGEIVEDNTRQEFLVGEKGRPNSTGSMKSKYKTPLAPRGLPAASNTSSSVAGVISKSELEETRKNLGLGQRLPAQQTYQVDGVWYVDNLKRPRSRKAPQGVPKLQLGVLADNDDELRNPRTNHSQNLTTPDSHTSISWGTPVDNCYYPANYTEEKSYQVCSEEPEERLLSDQRRKPTGIPNLDLQLSHSGNEQFMQALRERNKLKKQQNEKESPKQSEDGQPQKEAERLIKVANEKAKLRETRKNEIIDEALFGDELTKEVTPSCENVASPSVYTPSFGPREKRHQALFNRNPTATTSNTENVLSHRLRFSARILSKDGHDAHRELNGFFFPDDDTLTVYEFRQFGSRSSALPFIQRGTYHRTSGTSKNQLYSLQDICVGNDLVFDTVDQLSLPDNLKRKQFVTLRITFVDKEMKQKIAFREQNSPVGMVSSSHKLLKKSMTKEEEKGRELVQKLNAEVKAQLKKRGVKSMTALGRHFQSLDTTGNGMLEKDELKDALAKFNIRIPAERFDEVWTIVDSNHDGSLDYGEFTRNFIGEMSESRKALVLKIFRKMDPNKRGVVTFMNMAKFFSARQHPDVLAGKAKEDDVQEEMLSTFEHCKRKGEVTYAEFEDYFEGLSLTLDDDDEFIMILRNCWGV